VQKGFSLGTYCLTTIHPLQRDATAAASLLNAEQERGVLFVVNTD